LREKSGCGVTTYAATASSIRNRDQAFVKALLIDSTFIATC
jgi:hypothetical protein